MHILTTITQTHFVRFAIGIGIVLLIPFVAMQLSDQVQWTAMDFVVAAGLLSTAALVYELATRKTHSPKRRIIVAAVVLLVLATVWAQLAVGIFD